MSIDTFKAEPAVAPDSFPSKDFSRLLCFASVVAILLLCLCRGSWRDPRVVAGAYILTVSGTVSDQIAIFVAGWMTWPLLGRIAMRWFTVFLGFSVGNVIDLRLGGSWGCISVYDVWTPVMAGLLLSVLVWPLAAVLSSLVVTALYSKVRRPGWRDQRNRLE